MNVTKEAVVIMAGGIGSRFWPISRNQHPKQFLDILGTGSSLLQTTYQRFREFIPAENIFVVTNEAYATMTKNQLPELPVDNILTEPVMRNTAPCIYYATLRIHKVAPDATIIVSPSDHIITEPTQFQTLIQQALIIAQQNQSIITLGIKPSRPDTGYGYINYIADQPLQKAYKVRTFTEKPTLEIAREFVASGDYLWNSGLFVFSAQTMLKAIGLYLPELSEAFLPAMTALHTQNEKATIKSIYPTCKNVSIDYGVMEKADNVYVIPGDFGWSDLGTWNALYALQPKDTQKNVTAGKVYASKASGNLIQNQHTQKLIAVRGINDLIIIDTSDVLLICPRDQEQLIKELVSELKLQDDGPQFL